MSEYSEWACKIAVEAGVSPEAVDFILQAIDYVPNYRGDEPGMPNSPQHSSGADLCRAFVGLAKDMYGAEYIAPLERWGLNTSEKLGRAVYRLVECGVIESHENDQIDEFDSQFNLTSYGEAAN